MNRKLAGKLIVPWILVTAIGITLLAVAGEQLGINLADDLITALGPGVYHFEGSYFLAVIVVWVTFGWLLSLGQALVLKPNMPGFDMVSWHKNKISGWFLSAFLAISFLDGSIGVPLSIITGTILGFFYWRALKKQPTKTGWGLAANALVWGVGWALILPVIAEGSGRIGLIFLASFVLSLLSGLTLPGILSANPDNLAFNQ